MVDRICRTPGCNKPASTNVPRCSACNYKWQRASGKKFSYVCRMCGRRYETHRRHRGAASLCSVACRSWYANWTRHGHTPSQSLELVHVPCEPVELKPVHVRTDSRWRCGPCVQCGMVYVGPFHSRTCSAECGERRKAARMRAKEHRRRARERDAVVERFLSAEIYERDRFRCHICGRKTRPDRHYLDPRYPTIDHLIPLAKGGPHTRANVATACRICNSSKSDVGTGDQLALI